MKLQITVLPNNRLNVDWQCYRLYCTCEVRTQRRTRAMYLTFSNKRTVRYYQFMKRKKQFRTITGTYVQVVHRNNNDDDVVLIH